MPSFFLGGGHRYWTLMADINDITDQHLRKLGRKSLFPGLWYPNAARLPNLFAGFFEQSYKLAYNKAFDRCHLYCR